MQGNPCAPQRTAIGPICAGDATYLSAEELPDQGGGHLLHEEAVHAGSAHEARRAAPGPGRLASKAALPWRRVRGAGKLRPFLEPSGWGVLPPARASGRHRPQTEARAAQGPATDSRLGSPPCPSRWPRTGHCSSRSLHVPRREMGGCLPPWSWGSKPAATWRLEVTDSTTAGSWGHLRPTELAWPGLRGAQKPRALPSQH